MRLTHAAARGMVARGAGGILNVASLAGFQPTPNNATYAATKAFVTSFTEAVHEELKGTGVSVSVLVPGLHAHGVPGARRLRPEERPGVHVAGSRRRSRGPASTALAKNRGRDRSGRDEQGRGRAVERRAVQRHPPRRPRRGASAPDDRARSATRDRCGTRSRCAQHVQLAVGVLTERRDRARRAVRAALRPRARRSSCARPIARLGSSRRTTYAPRAPGSCVPRYT